MSNISQSHIFRDYLGWKTFLRHLICSLSLEKINSSPINNTMCHVTLFKCFSCIYVLSPNLHFAYKESELQKIYLLKITPAQWPFKNAIKVKCFPKSNLCLLVQRVSQKSGIGIFSSKFNISCRKPIMLFNHHMHSWYDHLINYSKLKGATISSTKDIMTKLL